MSQRDAYFTKFNITAKAFTNLTIQRMNYLTTFNKNNPILRYYAATVRQ